MNIITVLYYFFKIRTARPEIKGNFGLSNFDK
jgi:hypothetical protein